MPTFDQDAFRVRNDDGSETAASWAAPLNTNVTMIPGEPFRVRFVVQETTTGSTNQDFKLQGNRNATGWGDVTATQQVIRAYPSPFLTDQDDTTQQIGSGTFVTDNDGVEDSDGAVPGVADFAGGDETELEFCVLIVNEDVKESDTIQLRVVEGDGTVFGSYTNTPTITVGGKYNHVARTVDQPAGIQTVNRLGQALAQLDRAFEAKHEITGSPRIPAGTHVDPLIPVALGYVGVDSVTGTASVKPGAYALRAVSRQSRGEYVLSFDSRLLAERAEGDNLIVHVTPVGGLAWPFVQITGRGTVRVVLYTHIPEFSVSRGSDQGSVSGWTVVQFDSETFDRGGNYDNATNYRFTAPVAGRYSFTSTVTGQDDGISGSPEVTKMELRLVKNGSTIVAIKEVTNSGTASATAHINWGPVILAASDTVLVQGRITTVVGPDSFASGSSFYGIQEDGDNRVDRDFCVTVRALEA